MYVKRTKYTIKNDDNVKDELLDVLLEKGIPSNKARIDTPNIDKLSIKYV